jgi:hypothetical protein
MYSRIGVKGVSKRLVILRDGLSRHVPETGWKENNIKRKSGGAALFLIESTYCFSVLVCVLSADDYPDPWIFTERIQ